MDDEVSDGSLEAVFSAPPILLVHIPRLPHEETVPRHRMVLLWGKGSSRLHTPSYLRPFYAQRDPSPLSSTARSAFLYHPHHPSRLLGLLRWARDYRPLVLPERNGCRMKGTRRHVTKPTDRGLVLLFVWKMRDAWNGDGGEYLASSSRFSVQIPAVTLARQRSTIPRHTFIPARLWTAIGFLDIYLSFTDVAALLRPRHAIVILHYCRPQNASLQSSLQPNPVGVVGRVEGGEAVFKHERICLRRLRYLPDNETLQVVQHMLSLTEVGKSWTSTVTDRTQFGDMIRAGL
ncbi:hypothetical protein C8F01DRAFT_1251299 [Mycena amicta]|nr:hypothetical protein C8F01DRAFT_1251299 [Mycena amicta]